MPLEKLLGQEFRGTLKKLVGRQVELINHIVIGRLGRVAFIEVDAWLAELSSCYKAVRKQMSECAP